MPDTSRSRSLILAAILVTVLAWASAFVAIRDGGRAFDPGPLAFGCMLVGTAALTVAVLARGIRMPPRRLWWSIAAYGVARPRRRPTSCPRSPC